MKDTVSADRNMQKSWMKVVPPLFLVSNLVAIFLGDQFVVSDSQLWSVIIAVVGALAMAALIRSNQRLTNRFRKADALQAEWQRLVGMEKGAGWWKYDHSSRTVVYGGLLFSGDDLQSRCDTVDDFAARFKTYRNDSLLSSIDQSLASGERLNVVCLVEQPGGDHAEYFFEAKVVRDPAGKCSGLIGLVRDCSEIQETRRQLKRMESIVEQSPVSVVVADHLGVINYVNPKFCEITGYSRDEVLGRHTKILQSGKTDTAVYEDLWKTITAGNPWQGELINRKKSGELFWESLAIVPFLEEDGQQSYLATKLDITAAKEAEKNLLANAQKLHFSLIALEAFFWEDDLLSEKLRYHSPGFWAQLGYGELEIPQNLKEFSAFVHPEDRVTLQEIYKQLVVEGEKDIVKKEFRIRRKDGSWSWILNTARALEWTEDGKPVKIIGLNLDISQQKRIEELLRSIFDAIPVPLLIVNISTSHLMRANDAFCNFVSLTRDELKHLRLLDLLIDSTISWPRMLEVCRNQERIELELKQGIVGTARWVLLQAIFFDYLGHEGMLVSFVDISEWRASQRELAEKQQFLQSIIDYSGAQIYAKDIAGKYILVNHEMARAFAPEKGSPLGKTDYEILGEEVGQDIREKDQIILSTLLPQVGEEHFVINGEEKVFQAAKFPLLNANGKPYAICGMMTDITARKHTEEDLYARIQELDNVQAAMLNIMEDLDEEKENAKAATKAKSSFLANMSHEIRTPMNAIMGMTHLALQTSLTARQQDYLNTIDASSKVLLRIINDILDFSKIEADRLELEQTVFLLDAVIDNLAALVTVQVEEKGLELLFRIAPDVPGRLVGDPLRLGQILLNLINNAIKFTEKGEIVLSASVQKRDEHHALLYFSVADTGIGLTVEEQERLFQSFSQADASTTRRFGGTGLGLAISKRLVGLMGGKIGVTSVKGQGSTFWFTVRLGLHEGPQVESSINSRRLQPLKILVVDDNRTSLEILTEMLKNMGCVVETAEAGEEAVEKIRRHQETSAFDLILMDWKMPGMDGIETTKLIRQDKSLQPPVVIMVSAYGREEVMQQAEAEGMAGFLMKPVNQSMLYNAILDVFGVQGEKQARENGKRRKLGGLTGIRLVRGKRVLLVEDNEINQEVASELLKNLGMSVVVASNGQEAVEWANLESFDIVFMDIQMPVMDGFEATERIRDLPGNHEVPIVAMTAHAMAGDREKSLEAGMNDHLTKPIDPLELEQTLVRWLVPLDLLQPSETIAENPQPVEARLVERGPTGPRVLNFVDGMDRLSGNSDIYLRLLGKFRDRHIDVVSRIQEAIARDELDTAIRETHNLKGVSANLGGEQVSAVAAELHLAMKEQRTEFYAGLFERLGEAMIALCQAIEKMLAGKIEDIGPMVANGSHFDREQFVKLIRQAKFMIADDLSAAIDRVENLRGKAGGMVHVADILGEVEFALHDFDVERAEQLLERLLELLEGQVAVH